MSPAEASPQARRRKRRVDLSTPSLLGLPLVWLAVFFLAPIAIVAAYSLNALSLYPGSHPVTFEAWKNLFNGSRHVLFFHSSVYLALFWKSVKMSLFVSIAIVLLA